MMTPLWIGKELRQSLSTELHKTTPLTYLIIWLCLFVYDKQSYGSCFQEMYGIITVIPLRIADPGVYPNAYRKLGYRIHGGKPITWQSWRL